MAGDGTEHYLIALSDGTVRDEDGLGLTYTCDFSQTYPYLLTAQDNSTMRFDSDGFLREARDSNGNTLTLGYGTYNYQKMLTSATIAGATVSITYSDHEITITDPANRVTKIALSNNRLTRITYPDSTFVSFEYDASTRMTRSVASDLTSIGYGYDNANRVVSISEKGSQGTERNPYIFHYENGQTRISDSKGMEFTYQFDGYGRPTAIYDINGATYSVSYTETTLSADGIFANNHPE